MIIKHNKVNMGAFYMNVAYTVIMCDNATGTYCK